VLFEELEHAREAVGSIAEIAGEVDDLLAESRFDGVEEEIESVVRVVESIDRPLIFELGSIRLPGDSVGGPARDWPGSPSLTAGQLAPLADRDEDDAEDCWDDLRSALADRVTQSADHIRFLLNETEDSLLLIMIERAEAGLEAGTGEIHSLVTELRSAHGLWLASWAELFNHDRDSLGDMGDRVTAFASWLGSGRTV